MSIKATKGNQSFPHDENEKVDALIEAVAHQSKAIEELQRESEQKDKRIADLEKENRELSEELSQQESKSARERAQIKQRVTSLEECEDEPDSDDETPSPQAEETTMQEQESETPLDRILSLPDRIAQQELTANQERARFIAKDVMDYATKVPAGYTITSADIRTILAAKEHGTPHTETVARVMNFLDRFGQDAVEIVKRRGKRRVVFTEAATHRYHHATAGGQTDITGVVMEATAG